MNKFKSVLITGASSGIGAAIAKNLAAPGIFLALTGRNFLRLERVANACRDTGALVNSKVIDVRNQKDVNEWILSLDSTQKFDLVIANAGVSSNTSGIDDKDKQKRYMIETNIFGTFSTIETIVPQMEERGYGTIGVVSSLAGFRGLPSAPIYSATKAWARSYGEALRGSLLSKGIHVSVICPGFVSSRITDYNNFYMPLKKEPFEAANIIIKGLEKQKARIAFPVTLYYLMIILSIIPPSLIDTALSWLPKKE